MLAMRRTARHALWGALVIAAGAQAWLGRYAANADGIGYLDRSDQLRAFGWPAPTNGSWCPLYPALLALARWLFGSGPALDYPLAHLVNFALCLIVFGCAEWLRGELVRGDDRADFASSMLCIAAAGWAAIRLVGTQILSPDMGVLAAVIGAAAATLRWHRTGSPLAAATLGAVLGVGYLMKAVMFPVALVFLVVATVAAPSRALRWRGASLAVVLFALIAAPQLVAVSRLHGRPTFGLTGTLNQAWHIGGVPGPLSEDHARPMSISPDSGISVVADTSAAPTPTLFIVDGRTPGTFPVWSDVSRWYPDSLTFHRSMQRQLYKTSRGVRLEIVLLLKFALVTLAAWLLTGRPTWFGRGTVSGWTLLVLGFAPLGMYALVNVEFRLIAPFELLVLLGLSRLLVRPEPLALLAAVALVAVVSALANDVRSLPAERATRAQWQQIAAVLGDAHERPPRVVSLGDVWVAPMYARLARGRIVAIMDSTDASRWWRAPRAERARVESQLDSIPDAFVVARAPAPTLPAGWSPVPGSQGYMIRRTGTRRLVAR